MKIEDNLKKLNISLPDPKSPVGAYVATKIVGKLLFISGQISADKNGLIKGVIGQNMSVEDGYRAAQNCGLSLLAQLNVAISGDFQKFKRVIRIAGFVNATNTFEDHPKVVNGVSDLMVSVFGENGKHMRIALGSTLPLGVAVEVEGLFELN